MRPLSCSLWVATIAVAALLVCATSVASAAVIHIPADQPTIAAGLAAASPGDTLLLADGSFYEHGLIISQPVTITSEHGPGYTDINASGSGRHFWVENVDGAVFRGLSLHQGLDSWGAAIFADTSNITIDFCVLGGNHSTYQGGGLVCRGGTGTFISTNFVSSVADFEGGSVVLDGASGYFTDCYFGNNQSLWGAGVAIYNAGATPVFDGCDFGENHAVGTEPYGGGVYCWNYASPTFINCRFHDNVSDYGGGGLMLDENTQAVVTNCSFENNSAVWGGGIETWEMLGGTVTGCTFTGNTAQGGAGVLYEQSENLVFADCTFSDNVATEAGGGFSLLTSSPGPTNCTFTGNSAMYGGGMAVAYCTAPVVSDCSFSRNTAMMGGAIAVEMSGSPVVTDCTAAENTADYGAGIAFTHCSTPSVSGSTLVLNHANAEAAGVAVAVGTTLSVERTIIGFSTAGEAIATDGAPVVCTTTAVYGNLGGDWVGIIAGQEGSNYNIATDPYLCGVLEGDYTLCEDSPCLPENNGAGVLVGAYGEGCAGPCGAAVEMKSWGGIKGMYR